jgi:nicotinate-nucleotide pyrophosphorylase (carboxylating)
MPLQLLSFFKLPYIKDMTKKEIQVLHALIRRALDEDYGDGDVTSECTIPARQMVKGTFIAKAPGVIAGLLVASETIAMVDRKAEFDVFVEDGDVVAKGKVLATLRGKGRAVLGAERTALNFLQRMSGIATATRQYVDAVRGTNAIILDTRKTVPGLRMLDKLAVKLGGGSNHRIGLFDMVLIKENHIAAAGGITQAVTQVWRLDAQKRPIEVEVKNLTELQEALTLKVDRIMLDNMNLEEMLEAVEKTAGRIPLEASGNVTLENVGAVAATGVDFISVGALTHSVRALDISFLIEEEA